MRVHIALHDRRLSHGASLQEVSQERQGIPPGEVPPSAFGLHSHHGRQRREKKKESSLVLFLKPISHLCVSHLKSIYSEKSSLLSYPRYWTYPSAPIFLIHFIQKRILRNSRQCVRREHTAKYSYMESKCRKCFKEDNYQLCQEMLKDWVEHPPHALSSVARAKIFPQILCLAKVLNTILFLPLRCIHAMSERYDKIKVILLPLLNKF